MSSISKKETKSGTVFYEIRCHVGRDRPTLTKRWYPPDGWSQKSIDRELNKVAGEFERQCKAGEILSRTEQAEQERLTAIAAQALPTLRQFTETVFLPAFQVTSSEHSVSSYRVILKTHIFPALGEVKLPELTPAQISALLTELQREGKSHGTVIKVYTVLRGVLKKAFLDDVIDRNPMDKVARPKPRKDEIKKDGAEAYTVDEVVRILNCLSKEPLKWQTYMYFLIDTGVRRGEAVGLKWEDIDFQSGILKVQRSVGYTPERGIYVDTTKNRRMRSFDLDPQTLALLRRLRQSQCDAGTPSEWVFTQNDSADVMHPDSPTRYMKKFTDRYGIDHLHPHKLRHSFASISITNGADIASVSEKLGHSDKAVTLRMYTHSNPERIHAASQIFRAVIANAAEKQELQV